MLKLVVCLLALSCSRFASGNEDPTKIHAVLISAITCDAGCSISYAVEAEIARAYRLLINQGVPAQNIIVFHKDDVTNSAQYNPYPGTLYNEPNRTIDYRPGLKIDYTGNDVTVENVLAVLQGEKEKVKGGNGRVLESTEENRVFLFHGGHGKSGVLAFPDNTLMTSKQLNDALKAMQQKKMYKELVFYLLACHSGSIFEGQLTDDQNVYVFTAASPNDSAHGRDCQNVIVHGVTYGVCFSTEYGYGWLTDTETHDPNTETLDTQFNRVKEFVKMNVVQRYGNMKITEEPLGNFEGSKNESTNKVYESKRVQNGSPLPISQFAEYLIVKRKLAQSNNFNEQTRLTVKLKEMEQEQKDIKQMARDIATSVLPKKFTQFNQILNESPQRISQLDCHHNVMQEVSQKCLKVMKSPFIGDFLGPMAQLCEHGVQDSAIIAQLNKHCSINA